MSGPAVEPGPVAVIGTGNLGAALVRGLIATATVDAAALRCVVRRPERAAALAAELPAGVTVGTDVAAAVEGATLVVLGVKPQVLPDVLPAVGAALDARAVVVSLAAGVGLATLEAALPPGTPVVRVMTNTPIAVRAAASVLAAGTHADPTTVARVAALLAPLGLVRVLDEASIDAVTALSGSGPAYAFLLVEALVAGGEALGLARADATALAVATLGGAARLLEADGAEVDPAALRRAVTSPAGTTAAALAVLEGADLVGLVGRAMAAAAARAAELGA